ncbi:hypothetical protein BGZ46_002253 [Entomortierella lignicola]|nr:hypothetical protein BGZ46_002253 [Entomortierella lignicola]
MVNFRLPRLKRYTILGVPITYELVLRVFLFLLTIAALVLAARPKINSILQEAKVVGVNVTDEYQIRAPSSLICSPYFQSVQVQGVIRGGVLDNGTRIQDRAIDISPSVYSVVDISTLELRTQGDWPSTGNCLVLKPVGVFFGVSAVGTTSNATIDTIAITLLSDTNFTAQPDMGLSMSMWDGDVDIKDQQPIWNSAPSINTLTFVYSEHILTNGTIDTRYTMQKQNLLVLHQGFANKQVVARVVISPDTFYVSRYFDRPSYTWVDLAGAVGGMASIALAVWIFLFGSGKYKSWGIIQRYVLRTSPDSKKDRKVPESMSGRIAQVFRKQLSGWNSGAENDLDSVPLQSGSQDYTKLSGRYNTVVNMSTTDAAAMVATGSSKGNRSNTIPQNRNNEAKYSMEGPSDFYFSDQGAPGTLSLRPLAPIGEGGDEDDAEEQVSELIRLIDLRIDERMWSLEKTLARYYLDGFRLRNYSRHNSGNQYYDGKDIEAGMNPFDDSRGMTNVNKQNATSVPEPPKSPTSPAYPPRPKLNHQYEVIDELGVSQASSTAGPIETTATRVPYPNNGEISETASSNSISPTNTLLPPGFPQRRDMRGTIRRAVERLQNEWPHSNLPEPYVPRTHYRSLDNNNNGSPTAGIPPNPYATDGRPSEPPTY